MKEHESAKSPQGQPSQRQQMSGGSRRREETETGSGSTGRSPSLSQQSTERARSGEPLQASRQSERSPKQENL